MSDVYEELHELLAVVAFPETPEERDAAWNGVDALLAGSKAEAWDEGRDSLARDFAKPLSANGFREATKNPYRDS